MNGTSGTLTVHIIDAVQLPVVNHIGKTQLHRLEAGCRQNAKSAKMPRKALQGDPVGTAHLFRSAE